MKTIEASVTVTEDGQMIMTAPSHLPAGKHRVVVVIDEEPMAVANGKKHAPLRLSAHAAGLADDSFTFRRDDLYAD